MTQLDSFYHVLDTDTARQTLLLCDCKSYPPDYFLQRLQIYFRRHGGQTKGLFYNLARNVPLEIKLLKSGIQGIVHPDEPPEILLNAINIVLNGQHWASRHALSECLQGAASVGVERTEELPKKLTPRECQILRMITDGSSNESIAEYLCISRHTVKTHLYNIFRKINVSSRMKAAKWAEQHLPAS
jgi:LuxR family transcriptional regulator of csgAB operon